MRMLEIFPPSCSSDRRGSQFLLGLPGWFSPAVVPVWPRCLKGGADSACGTTVTRNSRFLLAGDAEVKGMNASVFWSVIGGSSRIGRLIGLIGLVGQGLHG